MSQIKRPRRIHRPCSGAIVFAIIFAVLFVFERNAVGQTTQNTPTGVSISYRLPAEGPLPQTYRVTLAITSATDPRWIISTFVSGAVRTVTAANGGKFTETWNGLDDNFMPVPPGTYGVKGIVMPAQKWAITGEYHTLRPKLAVAAGDSWFPKPDEDGKLPWNRAAGFGTMTDVAVSPNGHAVFLHHYLENALNPYVVDLTKPIGHDQILQGYPSAGTAGGNAVATDGDIVWATSPFGRGKDIIYRPDGKPFGQDYSQYRDHVFVASGEVNSLAAWHDSATNARFLYVAQKSVTSGLLVLNGNTGTILKEEPLHDVQAVTTDGKFLFILNHESAEKWTIDRAALKEGIPSGEWRVWLRLDRIANPIDFKVDTQSHTFVSDETANQVYEFDRAGELIRRFGRASTQQPGHYDDHVFMSPTKLALWTDTKGKERLIVVERAGPGRVSEWDTNGKLMRQWFPGEVTAASGYAVDPGDPSHVYMTSADGNGIIRFRVDYGTGDWKVDAVWTDIALARGCPGGWAFPKIINTHGNKYLGFALTQQNDEPCGYMLYRLDGDRLLPSAGLVRPAAVSDDRKFADFFWWNDANGNGKVDPSEYLGRPAKLPLTMNYWGDTWLDDLSLTVLEDGGRRLWRIAPSRFDAHGNPIFDSAQWTVTFEDPVVASLEKGQGDPRHGGNELAPNASNTWRSIDGLPDKGFVVAATTGPGWPNGVDSTGRVGAQIKISRYLPDGAGGYKLVWRAGRKAFGLAEPGEIYGALHVSGPINGLIAVQDGNGLVDVFTADGLYVDTLFFDVFRGGTDKGGVYALGGELFNGYAFLNRDNGEVYLAIGREAATLYEVSGWSGTDPVVTPIPSLPTAIILNAAQTSPAPDAALRLRDGATTQQLIVFQPAPGGGPALDGSLDGWEASSPRSFGLDKDRAVDVRAMYDPDALYLRAHIRLPRPPQFANADALGQIFTDAAAADTFSFYIQGNPAAQGTNAEGRPGDARFVFALAKDPQGSHPIVLGLYPSWNGAEAAHPIAYRSPVGTVSFAQAGPVQGVKLGSRIDPDGNGFTIAAAIPRAAIPMLPVLGANRFLHTTVDFEATLGGKTKFWWANAGGLANTVTSDVPSEARLYPGAWSIAQFVPLDGSLSVGRWLVSGPWGGPGRAAIPQEKPGLDDSQRWKLDVLHFYEDAHYPPDGRTVLTDPIDPGPMSIDANGAARDINWRIAPVDDGDAEVRLAAPGELYYAATWIWSRDARTVQIEFLHAQQNVVRAWIDGTEIPRRAYAPPPFAFTAPVSPQPIMLHAGWNLLMMRGFAVGYDLRLGARLHDSADRLWQIQLSPTGPR